MLGGLGAGGPKVGNCSGRRLGTSVAIDPEIAFPLEPCEGVAGLLGHQRLENKAPLAEAHPQLELPGGAVEIGTDQDDAATDRRQ